MKHFLVKAFCFLAVFTAICYVLTYMTDKGLRKSKGYFFAQWNDIYNSRVNADVLFTGSSRAFIMISPKIVDSVLHTDSYNIGMDGWQFNMQYARFKIYLQHNKKPRYIVQSIDIHFFEDRTDLYHYEQFLPDLYDTILRKATSKYTGHFTIAELYFPLFKYNGHADLIREGITSFLGKKQNNGSDTFFKGYSPRYNSWDSSFSLFKKANPDGIYVRINQKSAGRFEEYLDYCKANGIQVIFTFVPIYFEELEMEKNSRDVMLVFSSLCAKYDIPFLDYTHDSLCYDKKYFYNSQHMNERGARIFSNHLAHDLIPYINSN